ncbi:MAG TPA: hypothetical protein VK574_15240 [Terracidiphilus sp.]|nr:hypothetical protein [Terracidiphilus sp.]
MRGVFRPSHYTVPMRPALILLAFLAASSSHAQFTLQTSNTTADLRGIHNVGNGVAWASGTNGTVLRTEDGGYVWQSCSMPPDAEKLDFRGIESFNANTAIVMSSGPGDQSRLYRTTDGCHTWKLVFTNPDETGFFDSVHFAPDGKLYVLGDPVKNAFALFLSDDYGDTWFAAGDKGRDAHANEGAFAASNSSFTSYGPFLLFGAGGSEHAHAYWTSTRCSPPPGHPNGPALSDCGVVWNSSEVPVASGTPASGIFSLAAKATTTKSGAPTATVIAVGGVYDHPDLGTQIAAFSVDGGQHWTAAITPPHGYRSAVAYDPATKTWITVGPNGTDISTDDGKNWHALHPDPALHDPPDADRNWNALSLPFVVGPHGRIGRLDERH